MVPLNSADHKEKSCAQQQLQGRPTDDALRHCRCVAINAHETSDYLQKSNLAVFQRAQLTVPSKCPKLRLKAAASMEAHIVGKKYPCDEKFF